MSPIDVGAWGRFPAGGDATAPRTGPFPFKDFLATAWGHHHDRDEELVVAADPHGSVAFATSDRGLRFVGPEHLTDYHTPLGTDPVDTVAEVLAGFGGHRFRFDSLPREAATAMAKALDRLGADHATEQHAVTAVLDLPHTYDDWLMAIGKKERHEVRRKRRRRPGRRTA